MLYHYCDSIQQANAYLRLGTLEFNCTIEPADNLLWNEISTFCKKIKSSQRLEDINKMPNIASARTGYKLCGKDPNRYRPSADSLLRRIVKGNDLYKVNNVIDILNFVSVQTGISIGGYDADKIDGEISIDIGRSEDEYFGIGRGKLNIEGLPVLRDNTGVFGCPTSDSTRTMITDKSQHILFVYFNFSPTENLVDIINNTIHLLEKYTKGNNFRLDPVIQ
jgi:DNA/RNA-binding domain of Phe-tRNA-synthetase-like protein